MTITVLKVLLLAWSSNTGPIIIGYFETMEQCEAVDERALHEGAFAGHLQFTCVDLKEGSPK